MKRKKLPIIIGIVVLVIALAGVWGYSKFLKPDPAVQQELYDQFGKDFFSFDDQDLDYPPETDPASAGNPELPSGSGPAAAQPSSPGGHEKPEQNQSPGLPAGQETGKAVVTEAEISSKYQDRFTYLQSLALSRLDTLFNTALQEYRESKKAGKANRTELFQKYYQAASTLETNVDSQFYSALTAMEAELKVNNLSTDQVDAFRDIYEKAKSDKRSQFLAEVR